MMTVPITAATRGIYVTKACAGVRGRYIDMFSFA